MFFRRLVHTDQLKLLAAEAQQRVEAGDLPAARDAWKRALELLPRETVQYGAVAERLRELDRRITQNVAENTSTRRWKSVAIVGPLIVFLLTKGFAVLSILLAILSLNVAGAEPFK